MYKCLLCIPKSIGGKSLMITLLQFLGVIEQKTILNEK